MEALIKTHGNYYALGPGSTDLFSQGVSEEFARNPGVGLLTVLHQRFQRFRAIEISIGYYAYAVRFFTFILYIIATCSLRRGFNTHFTS